MLRHILSRQQRFRSSGTRFYRFRTLLPLQGDGRKSGQGGQCSPSATTSAMTCDDCAVSRKFSTMEATDSSTEINKSLDRVTFYLVNPNRNPLGTMTSFDDATTIMSGWLKREEWEVENEPDKTTKLNGRAVDAAERLLERLIHEKATNRPGSLLRRQRDIMIAEWQLVILNSWIHVATLQQHDRSLLAASSKRAELALARIVDWYNQGGCWLLPNNNDQDPLPVSSFVKLCRLWLKLDRADGLIRAADLLITWTEGEHETSLLEGYKSDIAQCFNETINQCTNLLRRQDEKRSEQEAEGEGIGKTAVALVERMDLLRAAGWDELVEISALARKIVLMENLQQTPVGTDEEDKSRQFEEAAMFQQMTNLIRVADNSDEETIVDEVIPRVMASNSMPKELAREISSALVDFFIRVKDAKQATHWIQRLDMIDATLSQQQEESATSRFHRLLAIFELWTENEESDEVVWRAEELLRRCESLENDEGVEGDLYQRGAHLTMMRTWLSQCKDKDLKARKVHEIFTKIVEGSSQHALNDFKVSDAKLVVAAMASEGHKQPMLEAREINFLFDIMEKGANSSSEGIEDTLIRLIHSQRGKLTSDFLRRVEQVACTIGASDGTTTAELPAALCHAILQSALPDLNSTTERINLIGQLGGFDDSRSSSWNVDGYKIAIAALLEDLRGDIRSPDAAKKLLGSILARLAEKEVADATEETVNSVLVNALNQCLSLEADVRSSQSERNDAIDRATLADELLVIAENRFLSTEPENILRKSVLISPISLSCFERVLQRFYKTRRLADFERTFLRLYNYFRIGGYDLLPDRSMLASYMECLLERKKVDGKELERILSEWAGHCKHAGRDFESNADEGIYTQVFKAYANQKAGAAAVDFALAQLQAMKAGQANVELASFVMERAIATATHSKLGNLYDLVVNRLFRRYGMDESLKLTLPVQTWRALLFACSQGPRNDFASKVAIISLTELREAGQIDHWVYNRIGAVHLRHGAPRNAQVLRVIFQCCCVDGFLSPSLKRAFWRGLGEDLWNEVYTARLSPDGQEPGDWSANLSDQEKTEGTVFFAEYSQMPGMFRGKQAKSSHMG